MSEKKIIYNGEEYANTVLNSQGVGEFTSNSGVKDPSGSNSEIFNNYYNNIATGADSHAEGHETKALGNYSHVEGYKNYSNVLASHTEGYDHSLDSTYILNDSIDYSALITDINAVSSGSLPTAGTINIISTSDSAHNEGNHNLVSGTGAHVEGVQNGGFGTGVHIEGKQNIGGGLYTHIEGFNNKNVTYYSDDTSFENPEYIWGRNESDQSFSTSAHIEGSSNLNCGDNSHIEGESNKNRKGNHIHVEGYNNTLTYAHTSHVEGSNHTLTGTSVATLNNVHVEGESNEIVPGVHHTHIEGANNQAVTNANYCHIAGQSNISVASHQTIIGRNCNPDGYALFIVGNGIINGAKSNAFTVSQTGVANAQTDVQVGGYSILENFAPAYDNTATYPAGSFCTYLGKLYTNPSAITTAEDFNSSHWTATTLSTIQNDNAPSSAITSIWNTLGPIQGTVAGHETRITALEQGGGGSSTVDAIVTNSSDEYDTSATYNVGDYCIYNNTLYRCITAVTAEVIFDSTKWSATTVISVLNTLNQRLAVLEALPNLDNEPL